MKFSYKLQELRKGSGMSQEEFAELLGVSRQSVSKWESGKGYPEIDKLIFISNYFNTSLDLLLKDTSDYNSNPSVSSSKSVRSRKRKNTISLTKPELKNDSSTTTYMSDPMPNKKKENYPLQRVSTPVNAQLRPIKNHKFGKKKINKSRLLAVASIGSVAIVGIVAMITNVVISNSYDEATYYVTTAVADEEVFYDETIVDYNNYFDDWRIFYDDDINSNIETQMKEDINNQMECLVIDRNNNVYSTGYDILYSYLNAQWNMKNELNCSMLYEKYIGFDYYQNTKFIEVYSYDFSNWIIMSADMLRIYPNQFYDEVEFELPIDNDFFGWDILNSSAEDYKDYNTSPFENVYRINKQSYAMVSSEILDLCSVATADRKSNLSMEKYIINYEIYNDRYDLVRYNTDIIFVPKDFIMINVSDLEDEKINEVIIQENPEGVENLEIVEESY